MAVQQPNALKGFLLALAGSLLISTNFVTVKYGLRGFNVPTLVLVWCVAAAVWAFVLLVLGRRVRTLAAPRSAWMGIIAMGVAGGASIGLGWWGLDLLDPSFAAFLWRFAPVTTILLGAVFLRERFSAWEVLAVIVMFVGSCWSALGRWGRVGPGMVITLASCFAGGLALFLAKVKTKTVSSGALAFYRVGIGSLVIAAGTFALMPEKVDFRVEAKYWGVVLLGALLGPCASHFLTFKSYQYWDLSRASIMKIAEPLFVLPLAWFFLRTLPARQEALGGLIILAGAFWLIWLHFRRRRQAARV